ncbi:MAG TPA: cyclic nucleotide-binding domain-containing protein [Thermoanaerobaculia bacterium]|nr:cyclic nucleotide-binding domain-containing protein [Thermoanaerobaculia bacterium]
MTEQSFDLVIVGAGPAGLSTAAHAQTQGMPYVLLERSGHLADTIYCYQRGKHVMAEPTLIPLRSEVPFEVGTREAILEAWDTSASELGLNIHRSQEVNALERLDGGGFKLGTSSGRIYTCKWVVLAMGTQGNPNRLGVPGEDLPHVRTRLVDPRDHNDEDIVVVGAGDSAIEIANSLAENNRVSLVVRKPEISRAKEANEREIMAKYASGEVQIFFSTVVGAIQPGMIHLKGKEEDIQLEADCVYLKLGAQPPRRWLEAIGVQFTSGDADAKPHISNVYESLSAPGIFLIGAVTGRDLIKLGMNQGYEVVEHLLGREVVPADEEILKERLPFWEGKVVERIEALQRQVPLLGTSDALQLRDVLLTISFKPEDVLRAPSTGDLREALLTCTARRIKRGQAIVQQNDYTDSVMVLVSGSANVVRKDEHGEHQVGQLNAGDFFGEMGLLSGRRRNASILANQDADVLEIPRKTMLKLIYGSPRVKRLIDEAFLVRAFQGYLFPNVPAEVLRALAKTAELVEYGRGETVIEEGTEGDSMYFIRSGQVKVSKMSQGREIILSYLVSGNFFGEGALMGDRMRGATVSTIFPSELIKLSATHLDEVINASPELSRSFQEKFEERRIQALAAEASAGGKYQILDELIRGEVVIGTDALIIDDYKCVRCGNCVAACEAVHDDGQARLSLTGIHFANILAPNSCWQCENPLCMLDCPPDALVRDSRGEIYIRDNCIGCGNCEANCPYDNIFMVHPKPKRSAWGWITALVKGGDEESGRTVAVKCDLCRSLATGPACVSSCPTGAAIRLNPEQYEQTIGDLVAIGRRNV